MRDLLPSALCKTFNNYDGYMHFYPRVPSNFLGGRELMMFVPYYIYAEYYRHHCWLLCGAYYSAIIHEFFHNFEGIYEISPTHGFKIENKTQWPLWYKQFVEENGGPCEIEYYHQCFVHMINPKGFKEIKYRQYYKTNLLKADVEKYRELVQQYSPEKVKRAAEYYLRRNELKDKKDITKALDGFLLRGMPW